MKEIRGEVEMVSVLPRQHNQFNVYLKAGAPQAYTVLLDFHDSQITADGKAVTLSDLMAWVLRDEEAVNAVLYDDEHSYVRVRKADFTKAGPVPTE